jgi:hypothetical protein
MQIYFTLPQYPDFFTDSINHCRSARSRRQLSPINRTIHLSSQLTDSC